MALDRKWFDEKVKLEEGLDVQAGAVIAHRCAPEVCSDGGKHQWDGEVIEMGYCSSVTCSKCGVDAMSVDQWTAP